jgi:exopolysaccharide biosynthesis protein
MEGLVSLTALARSQGALAAINGGFFNRVRELPLGGLKEQGAWLSGPILNRGAIAWQPGQQPLFSNIRMEEWLSDKEGNRWPIGALNSGYVQKGLGRYNSLWGNVYRPITSQETGWILENGKVLEIWFADQMAAGVPLRQGQALLVERGSNNLNLQLGDEIQLQRSFYPKHFEALPHLLQAGPLLLNQGVVVLDGPAENFSAAFMAQRAPRSVVAGDGDQVWLIALDGLDNRGPTLAESAELLLQAGLKQALNLDGGSSTALLVEGKGGLSGRGIGSAIHNGLGLIKRPNR